MANSTISTDCLLFERFNRHAIYSNSFLLDVAVFLKYLKLILPQKVKWEKFPIKNVKWDPTPLWYLILSSCKDKTNGTWWWVNNDFTTIP